MKSMIAAVLIALISMPLVADTETSRYVETPYLAPKMVVELFYNEPQDVNEALHWLRSVTLPLSRAPYKIPVDEMEIKVVSHGMEMVVFARKNYARYRDMVERMRYYASFGVEFKVCSQNAADYGYDMHDFYEFVQVVPSAITELVHWQMKGYAYLKPVVLQKKYSIEEIR